MFLPCIMLAAQHAVMNFTGQVYLSLLLTVLVTSTGFAKMDLSGLVSNSPFGRGATQEKSEAVASSQLELRGMVVEGDVVWFSFYDGATKTWATLREGERTDVFSVKKFNRAQEVVFLEYNGKPITLALKSTGSEHSRRESVASVSSAAIAPAKASLGAVVAGTSVASIVDAPVGTPLSPPVMGPAPSNAESKRLDLVASSIRQILEANRLKADSAGAKGT